jgi:hypothetical protein
MVCPSFWEDYYMLIYTHCWELMNSVGSHGSLSLPFVMKVMVCHFVSDSHEVMTALIVVLPIIVVVEISLQLHQAVYLLSFFTFVSTVGVHIAHSCNRECAHPLEAWQSKLTSLWFFLAFFKQKKRKKVKHRDLRTSLLPVPLLYLGLWCEFALHIFWRHYYLTN